MDFNSPILLVAAIAGVTELITRLRARDFWVVATISVAALIGGLFGFFGYFPDLDVVEGVIAGFSASGALTGLNAVGNKSVAKPTPLTK